MALKDCKFFVNVNGKKTEMDYDQFRAYLLEDANLNAVAPDLTRKKGAKAGYEVTAPAPSTPAKAKAEPARAEAAPSTTTVETVTAEPSEAKRIADSVGKQKVDAQGFTPAQREYLVDKVKEVYKEVQKDSAPDRFVIKVPGDGQFTVRTPQEANSIHRRLTGNNVPGAPVEHQRVNRKVVDGPETTARETFEVKKATDLTAKVKETLKPQRTVSRNISSGLFTDKKETWGADGKGVAFYPIELHGGSAAIDNISLSKDYVTDGNVVILTAAIAPEGAKRIKPSNRFKKITEEAARKVWDIATSAKVPAKIAGVWQSEGEEGAALIEIEDGAVRLNADYVKAVIDLTGADGLFIAKDLPQGKPVLFTKGGKPVAAIQPLLDSSMPEEASEFLRDMRRPVPQKAEAAPALAKQSPATPRPITAESLRETMGLAKAQAEAVLAVYKAMGLPLPTMRVAKGVFDKPELQEQYEKSMADEGMLARGYIEFFDPDDAAKFDGVLAVIRGFGAANFSTPVHEGAHFYRRFMLNEENGFTAQDIKTAEDWAGAKNGEWSVAAEEKWARGFERYLRSGQAPIPALNKLFEKIARWMRKVYETVTGSAIDVEVSPEVKRVFDKIFEIQAARQKGATGTVAGGKRDTLSQEESTVGPVWRSNIASALKTWNQDKGTPQQLTAHLGKVKGAQEEAKWIGLNEFLEGKKSVTKAEVADFVDSNPYIVEETVLDETSTSESYLERRFAGGEQYREIILTSPKIQRFRNHHYPDTTESYLAHLRVSTFTSEKGERVLLVDEAQSDLHQEGRKLGYATPEEVARAVAEEAARGERKTASHAAAVAAMRKAREQASALAASLGDKAITQDRLLQAATELAKQRPPRGEAQWRRIQQLDWISRQIQAGRTVRFRQRDLIDQVRSAGLVKDFVQIVEAVQRYETESQTYSRLLTEDERLSSVPIIPEAPFRESNDWVVMLFKRAVRLAAEEGADFVAWTPGEVQKERYPNGGAKLVKFYNEILPKALAKFARQWGGSLETVALKKPSVEKGEELPLGRQLGATSAERTFPAIRITPQMKAEAMKGFTLFQAEQGPGKVSAEAVKQKQAERARILKQEEPTTRAYPIDFYVNWQVAKIDELKKEISQKTGRPFSLLTLSPEDLNTYEQKLNEIEQSIDYYIKEMDAESQKSSVKSLVEKVALNWAGVSEITPAEPPTPSTRFETGEPVLVKVYHGTGPAGIKGGAFSSTYSGVNTQARSARQGYFFAGSRLTSEAYLKTLDVKDDWSDEDWDDEKEGLGEGITDLNWLLKRKKVGKIHEFYVKLNNPLVYGMERDRYRDKGYSALMEEAKKKGHDGVIITNTYDGGALDNIFAVLHGHENQIKSADAVTYGPDKKPVPLSERFNPDTTSIYFQDDRPVTASTDSAFVQRKMKERAERLRQAKAGQSQAVPEIGAIPDEVKSAALKWAGVPQVTPSHPPQVNRLLQERVRLIGDLRARLLTASDDTLKAVSPAIFKTYNAMTSAYTGAAARNRRSYYVERIIQDVESDPLSVTHRRVANALRMPSTELEKLHDIHVTLFSEGGYESPSASRVGIKGSELLTPSSQFATGRPVLLAMYHGTGEKGVEGGAFAAEFGGKLTAARSAKQGYFFAGSSATAQEYALGATTDSLMEQAPKVFKFFVKLQNPYVYDMKGASYRERTYFNVINEAKRDGHDGVIITNTYDEGPLDTIVTVLHGHENQIKSADAVTYGPNGKRVPLSERFNPKTTSIYFQDDRPVTASTDSAFVQRKMKERAERLRQAKTGQAATGEAKPKAEAKTAPPPPPQAERTVRPSGTTRPSSPRRGGLKTDEQRLKDAKERAAKPPAEPSEETMVNRKVQAFINTFAKSLFAGSIPLTTTDAAGNQVDTESVFLDLLKQYRAAFAATDQGRVDAVSAKLREITRPPRAPKDLKQLMEEAKKRAGQPKTAKTAAQKREQDIGKEVQKAINNFARLRSTGKISEMVDLGDGVTVSRENLLLQALADLQAAYRTSSTYLGAPEIAKAQRRIMDILFVPPRVPKKPYTAENILTAHAWGTASVRSPLSYLNMVGSYEAIAGELGARVSEIFQFTRTQMAHGYYPSWGAAITDLQRSLKGVKEELRQAGYPGMLPVIDAHVDRIRKSAEGVGPLTPKNVKKAWDNGNIGGLAGNVAKAFVFNTSLRFSPKAVLMNYMQPLFTLFPHVTPKEFYNFWVESGKPETIARVRDLALKESGGRIEGMGTESKFFNPFTKASERARIMGHLAGEMMADRLNLKGLARDVYVRGWTEKVEFDNSAWNVPPAFSGNLNSVLFQFKPYVAKNVERFVADWKRGVEGSSSGTLARRAKLIGVQLGVGGVGSLLTIMPGVKGITGILILGYLAQAFSAATGDDEFGEKIAESVFYGAPAWIGLDLASSTGFLEEPFGDDTFQQALNLVAGPAVYKSAAAINGLRKYYEDAQKVAPLGKEKEKEEVLARRRRTILNAITPLSRIAETVWTLGQGKRPDMFLEEPTPLRDEEVILRLLGGSPIRQTKFYDYKESFDWQKSLLNRPVDVPGIKRLKKETDATYKERVKRIEGWREQYRNELTSHPRFSQLSPEDQEKAFELLQRNITEQANQVRPNEAVLKPARILRSVMTSKVESKARARKRLYTEPED